MRRMTNAGGKLDEIQQKGGQFALTALAEFIKRPQAGSNRR
jgi:hypothetical protein